MNRVKRFFSRTKDNEDRKKIKLYIKENLLSVYTIDPEENSTVQNVMESRGLANKWLFLEIKSSPNPRQGRQVDHRNETPFQPRELGGNQPSDEGVQKRQVEVHFDRNFRKVFFPEVELEGAGVLGRQPLLRPGSPERQRGYHRAAGHHQQVRYGQRGQGQA